MEEEFIKNQERLKPQEEKQEVSSRIHSVFTFLHISTGFSCHTQRLEQVRLIRDQPNLQQMT